MVSSLSFDESVLLDWLISTESNFLTYFREYLAYIEEDFSFFVTSINTNDLSCTAYDNCFISSAPLVDYSLSEGSDQSEESDNDKELTETIMSCLIKLHLKLERLNIAELLPQNLLSLLDIFESIEQIYEN